MHKFYLSPTPTSPEIHFSPDENIFLIRGRSSPEDVRKLYYPVIEWIKSFIDDLLEGKFQNFSQDNPLRFQADFEYFNSSSAKFLYDIFLELNRIVPSKIPFIVEWLYDYEDIDMKEAGEDIALLVDMEFVFTPKER